MMVIFQSTGTMGYETSERQGERGRSPLMCSPYKAAPGGCKVSASTWLNTLTNHPQSPSHSLSLSERRVVLSLLQGYHCFSVELGLCSH